MENLIATFSTPAAWVAVLTLALLEIVLGIDNLVFIAILTGRLPKDKQKSARQFGLAAALVTRLMLLFSLAWIAKLTVPLFEIGFIQVHGEPLAVTGKTIVLLGGGLFLIYKAVSEIYHKVELKDEGIRDSTVKASVGAVILNIALMDVIFSLDSVITAVGMVEDVALMVAGRCHRDDRHGGVRRSGLQLHQQARLAQDSGACVPAHDRDAAYRGGP